ncbi:uncharacterized protein PHALS_08940 [Plasmopara halstedii]|uniref:Uncharacterized protein n=1 Tax=Plasmopara halstedii TaxID=4781 RepID=A0A0P1ADV7_PLAHL|nr:uncharacterized protein PHALS_08940 [Plasmopara halstedii]CEG38894.1 hypothetical protein PHALS_08940 [Plasmopara halstedii]|eukprot:XP_024575263.1 hypothetical protein PHALS_08940 [Plasmopara halstedii]
MVGLSASELRTETLFPGDTIEYFSMAFVAGDPRGHRLSKVLHVDHLNDEFPIRVDTQEMLPLTIMLKRKRDRNDVEISSDDAKWRKLRTFRLVDGKVKGETCAARLNAGLKKSLEDAIESTRQHIAMEKVDNGSKNIMSNYLKVHAAKNIQMSSSQIKLVEERATVEQDKRHVPCAFAMEDQEIHWGSNVRRKHEMKKGFDIGYLRKKSRVENAKQSDKANDYNKLKSYKRKRNESSLKNDVKQSQKILSKYFSSNRCHRTKKKSSLDLNSFVIHAHETKDVKKIKEIEVKKRLVWGLDEYFALDEKKRALEVRKNGKIQAPSTKSSSHFSASKRKEWGAQQLSFCKSNKQACGSLQTWLKPVGKRKDEC